MTALDALIDSIAVAVSSGENRSRGRVSPTATFNLEEPIAAAIIWDYDVNHYLSDPLFYIEQTLRQKQWRWETFPADDTPLTLELPVWLGHYPEYTFLDMEVSFTAGGIPRLQTDHPLSREPDLRLLKTVDFYSSGWMPRILRWYDDVDRLSAGRLKLVYAMAWWRGCLDLAIQLRGYDNFVADTMERPQFLHDLMKFLVEQRCRWWDAYCRHFALPLSPANVADDWINVPFLSPAIFADFVLPRYLDIESFHGGIDNVHSCGNQTPIQRYLLELKTLPAFEVSAWTNLAQTLINVPPDKRLVISVHPNDVLCATPEEMEAKLRFITESCRGRNYSIGTSGLTPIRDDPADFIKRIRCWTELAHQICLNEGSYAS